MTATSTARDLRVLRARALHAAALLHWPGWIALVLLLGACAAAAWMLGGPMEQALRTRQSALDAARLELATMRTRPAPAAADDDVEALLARLESPDRLDALIKFVHERASADAILIDRAEYRAQSDLRSRAVRFEILLPARGEYPKLRHWIESVLQAYPMTALEELSMRRSAEGSAVLEARVRLSCWVRSRS